MTPLRSHTTQAAAHWGLAMVGGQSCPLPGQPSLAGHPDTARSGKESSAWTEPAEGTAGWGGCTPEGPSPAATSLSLAGRGHRNGGSPRGVHPFSGNANMSLSPFPVPCWSSGRTLSFANTSALSYGSLWVILETFINYEDPRDEGGLWPLTASGAVSKERAWSQNSFPSHSPASGCPKERPARRPPGGIRQRPPRTHPRPPAAAGD